MTMRSPVHFDHDAGAVGSRYVRGPGSPSRGAPIGVGLLGCGTVGGGVLRLLAEGAPRLAARIGAPLEVRRVLVRDRNKARVPECEPEWVTTTPEDVLEDPAVSIVVEVMGGEDDAFSFVERALRAGKGVVTANKLLLASRGPELLEIADRNNADLAFEGAVGGGIPIVRTLREAFASDTVKTLTAILNGTCNYMLTRMTEGGVSFDAALKEAQAKGYAEADPSLDIDGHDAAHKLIVLAMLAFGARVDPSRVLVEGIRHIDEVDIRFAARFGYVLKHLAVGRDTGEALELRVHPTLIPKGSVLANVSGVLNAVHLEGRALGPCLVYGRGAGDMPTAVSVVADILDVARSIGAGVAGMQTRGISIARRRERDITDVVTRYYLRFIVADRPRVMAGLAGALGQAGVSIEQIVQQSLAESTGGAVDVVMITHRGVERQVRQALSSLAGAPFMVREPVVLRIEDV